MMSCFWDSASRLNDRITLLALEPWLACCRISVSNPPFVGVALPVPRRLATDEPVVIGTSF